MKNEKKIITLFALLLMLFGAMHPNNVYAEDENEDDVKVAHVLYTVKAVVTFKDYSNTYVFKIEPGGTISEPSHSAPSGYTFLGWFDENGELFDFTKPITRHVTLTAKYRNDNQSSSNSKYVAPATGVDKVIATPETNGIHKIIGFGYLMAIAFIAILIRDKKEQNTYIRKEKPL